MQLLNRLTKAFILFSLLVFAFGPSLSHAQSAAILASKSPQELQQVNAALQNQKAVSCSGWRYLLPTCWTQAIATAIGSTVAFVASWFMLGMGAFFDWSAATLVAEFGFYFPKFYSGISEVWITFRNLANIAIVGFFTFIAISIILGLKTYGQKKLIANVLIAATLINFSLLFVNIALTSSNMLSAIMYQQMLKSAGSIRPGTNIAGYQGSATPGETVNGPSRAFLRAMRYDQFGDVAAQLERVGNKAPNFPLAGSALVLIYAVLISVMFCVAGILFIYGAFLLVSRFIMFIILMLTAPFAFASFIIPSFSSSTFGWSGWWSSLIRTSMLAPLMMLLLWGTMSIIEKASAALQGAGAFEGASIGDLAVGTSAGAAGRSDYFLLVFDIIVLGLIYASFKMSSSFAHSIGVFNFAAAFPAAAFGAAGRFTGFVGRDILGRRIASAGGDLAIRGKNNGQSSSIASKMLGSLQQGIGTRLDKLGKNASFNIAKTGLGSEIAGLAKLSNDTRKSIEGSGKGFEKHDEERNKGIVEAIKSATVTSDEHKALNDAAIAAADKNHTSQNGGDSLEKLKESVDALAKTVHHTEEALGKAADDLSANRETAKALPAGSPERTQQEHQNALDSNSSLIDAKSKEIAHLRAAQLALAQTNPVAAQNMNTQINALEASITQIKTDASTKLRTPGSKTVVQLLEDRNKQLAAQIITERAKPSPNLTIIQNYETERRDIGRRVAREKRTVDELKKELQKLKAEKLETRDFKRIDEIVELIGDGSKKGKRGTLDYTGSIAYTLEEELKTAQPVRAAEIRTILNNMKVELAHEALARDNEKLNSAKSNVIRRANDIESAASALLQQRIGDPHVRAYVDPKRAEKAAGQRKHHVQEEAIKEMERSLWFKWLTTHSPAAAKKALEDIKKQLGGDNHH